MAIDKHQIRNLITRTLKEVNLYSEDAVNLIMGTAAQESGFGKYIRQLGKGPALGIFQMEPNTFNDILINYLPSNPQLIKAIKEATQREVIQPEMIEWDIKLAIIMTRVHYLRVPYPLPSTIDGYAKYWKKYYNTYLGAGTEEEYVRNYNKYILKP